MEGAAIHDQRQQRHAALQETRLQRCQRECLQLRGLAIKYKNRYVSSARPCAPPTHPTHPAHPPTPHTQGGATAQATAARPAVPVRLPDVGRQAPAGRLSAEAAPQEAAGGGSPRGPGGRRIGAGLGKAGHGPGGCPAEDHANGTRGCMQYMAPHTTTNSSPTHFLSLPPNRNVPSNAGPRARSSASFCQHAGKSSRPKRSGSGSWTNGGSARPTPGYGWRCMARHGSEAGRSGAAGPRNGASMKKPRARPPRTRRSGGVGGARKASCTANPFDDDSLLKLDVQQPLV